MFWLNLGWICLFLMFSSCLCVHGDRLDATVSFACHFGLHGSLRLGRFLGCVVAATTRGRSVGAYCTTGGTAVVFKNGAEKVGVTQILRKLLAQMCRAIPQGLASFFHRLAISNVRPETRLWILVQEASCWFHRPNRLHNGTRNCHFLLLGAGYVQLCKKSTYQTNKKLG